MNKTINYKNKQTKITDFFKPRQHTEDEIWANFDKCKNIKE